MMVAAVRHMQQYVAAPAVTGRIVNVTSVDASRPTRKTPTMRRPRLRW